MASNGNKRGSKAGELQSGGNGSEAGFEIVVEDERRRPASTVRSAPTSTDSGRRTVWIGVVAVVIALGVGAFWMVGGEDEDGEASAQDIAFDEEPGFEPYAGGSVVDEEPSDDERSGRAAPTVADAADDGLEGDEQESSEEPDRDIRPESNDDIEGPVRGLRQPGTLMGRTPDGDNVVADTRGEPMSRTEAENRLERELDAIENAQTDRERRIRRREARMNSRVLRQEGERGIQVARDFEISEEIQQRLHEQFSGAHARAFGSEEGVDAEDYDGVEEDEYYDDEDWYDEEDDWYDDDY